MRSGLGRSSTHGSGNVRHDREERAGGVAKKGAAREADGAGRQATQRHAGPQAVVARGDVEIRPLAASDEKALLAFARSLPVHDLLFLPRDISEPKVVKA